MKLHHAGLMAAVLAVAGFAAPAMAEKKYESKSEHQQRQAQKEDKEERGEAQKASAQQKSQKRIAQVSGKLVGLRAANLKGEDQPHILAKLQTRSGRTIVVDLGTRESLKGMRFRPNQPLSVQGPAGRINDRPVIVAERLKDDSRQDAPTIAIVRVIPFELQQARMAAQQRQQGQGQQQRAQQAAAQQRGQQQDRMQQNRMQQARQQQQGMQVGEQIRMLSGRILLTRDIQLNRGEQAEEHTIAALQTQRGTVLVDLGKADSKALNKVNLDRGQFITVVGTVGTVNRQPVLMADHVAELVTIDRDEDAQTAGGRMGGQQRSQDRSDQQNQ